MMKVVFKIDNDEYVAYQAENGHISINENDRFLLHAAGDEVFTDEQMLIEDCKKIIKQAKELMAKKHEDSLISGKS